MSTIQEIDHLLKDLGAFVAGGQSEEMVSAAETKLGVFFPPSFREYLLKWGNVSCEGYEYYGLTRNDDFDNGSTPNCVWFTLKKRHDVGLPHSLVVFRNINDEEYICIDTDRHLGNVERRVVIWDNVDRMVSQTLAINFADYLREELTDISEDV